MRHSSLQQNEFTVKRSNKIFTIVMIIFKTVMVSMLLVFWGLGFSKDAPSQCHFACCWKPRGEGGCFYISRQKERACEPGGRCDSRHLPLIKNWLANFNGLRSHTERCVCPNIQYLFVLVLCLNCSGKIIWGKVHKKSGY